MKRIMEHMMSAAWALAEDDAHEMARHLDIASNLANVVRDSIPDDERAELELGAKVYADAMNEFACRGGQ